MLEPKADRIYLARRAGALSRLRFAGTPAAEAEALCAAYEASADPEQRSRPTFWTRLEAWIAAEQRRAARPIPVDRR